MLPGNLRVSGESRNNLRFELASLLGVPTFMVRRSVDPSETERETYMESADETIYVVITYSERALYYCCRMDSNNGFPTTEEAAGFGVSFDVDTPFKDPITGMRFVVGQQPTFLDPIRYANGSVVSLHPTERFGHFLLRQLSAALRSGVLRGEMRRFEDLTVLDENFRDLTVATEASMVWSRFDKCDFTNTHFDAPSLKRSHFSNCDFTNVRFDNVGLSHAQFSNCSFANARFDCDTVLRNARFVDCDLSGARFEGSGWEAASFQNCIGALPIPQDQTMYLVRDGAIQSWPDHGLERVEAVDNVQPTRIVSGCFAHCTLVVEGTCRFNRAFVGRVYAERTRGFLSDVFGLFFWLHDPATRRFGTEIEFKGIHTDQLQFVLDNLSPILNLHWDVVEDASVDSELVSEPCMDPSHVAHDTGLILKAVKRFARTYGRSVIVASQHVHVGTFGVSIVPAAAAWAVTRQNSILKNQPPDPQRRRFCSRLDASQREIKTTDAPDVAAEKWTKEGRYNADARYRWINLCSIPKHGTIEFRLFNGSWQPRILARNCKRALQWVEEIEQIHRIVKSHGTTTTSKNSSR